MAQRAERLKPSHQSVVLFRKLTAPNVKNKKKTLDEPTGTRSSLLFDHAESPTITQILGLCTCLFPQIEREHVSNFLTSRLVLVNLNCYRLIFVISLWRHRGKKVLYLIENKSSENRKEKYRERKVAYLSRTRVKFLGSMYFIILAIKILCKDEDIF